MKIVRSTVSALGGIVLAALLIAALAPKAAHGLVAALVQIVPGTATHLGQTEGQMIQLYCAGAGEGLYLPNCYLISDVDGSLPDIGGNIPGYVAPPGYTLIITDVQWSAADYPPNSTVCDTDYVVRPPTPASIYADTGLTSCGTADSHGGIQASRALLSGFRYASGSGPCDVIGEQGEAQLTGYLVPN